MAGPWNLPLDGVTADKAGYDPGAAPIWWQG